MIEAVLLGAEEKFTRVIRVRFEDRRQRRLPFVIRLLDDRDYLLALTADAVDIEQRAAFRVFVDPIDEQARIVRRPNHPPDATDAFGFWQLDLEWRIAAAVGRCDHYFLLGPSATRWIRRDEFSEIVRNHQCFLFRTVRDDIRDQGSGFVRCRVEDGYESLRVCLARDLRDQ